MGLYVEALRGKRLSEENRRVIAQMAKSVAALQDLLDALLDISRLDAGSVRPIASAFALNPLLTRMQSQYAPDAIAKGVTFRFVPTRITVRSDPHLLERIVMNLVSNAVRYTQPGKVLLGCRRAGASVRIEVWDTGVGIAPEQQRLIFEEFYRIEGFGQDQERGYGLGLATVDRLARLLRHSVELRSVVGKGSVFTVTVPLAEAAAECGEGADRYRAVRSLKGVVVLVIDDDAQARGAMQTLLARWGCDVLTVSSGTEAVSLATTPGRPWPQIVISDYWLARDETGAQVLDRLCAAGSARFQGILVTGDASVEVVNAAHDRGYPLIQKPVRPARLRALLEHCLRLSSDRRDR
jgi:CheY-like chemotaxis protein/anti-sigma regulatory factor (Ser/Thr protein kinase)